MNRKSFWAALFSCVFILVYEWFISHKWDCACVLTYDIFGYYAYLPAYFYGELGHLSNLPDLIAKYHIAGEMSNFHLLENGNYIIKYTSGMSWLYLPFFGIAHLWAKLGGYPLDGFSQPYQAAILWGCSVYALAGLWIIRTLLLRYFEDRFVAISLVAVAIGTHYLNYAAFDSPMSHGPLFAVFALALLLIDNWYKSPTKLNALLLGLLCGFMMMTRPTEVFILIVVFFWQLESLSIQSITQRLRFFLIENRQHLALFALAFAIGLLPQLIYWHTYSGHWIYYSYGEEGFNFWGKNILKCFLSYQKGWLTYTPMMLFALIGIYYIWKRYTSIRLSLLIFFIINTYVLFSWHNWWYGGGFGQRALIDSYPLLMFPLTAFWTEINKTKMKYAVYTIAALFLSLNLFQIWQAQTGKFETEFMTKAYYWRIFGKTTIDEKIDKKLLDTKEQMPLALEANLTSIYQNDFEHEVDTIQKPVYSGTKSIEIIKDKSKEIECEVKIMPDNGWIRAKVQWLSRDREWNIWDSPMMYIILKSGDEIVKQNYIRPHRYRVLDCGGKWESVWIDMKIPKGVSYNKIVIACSTNSGIVSYIDDLDLSWAKEN